MNAKIYSPTKNVMQSGKANIGKWLLTFDQDNTRFTNPLIGWIGNSDMKQEIKLEFDNKNDAIRYAEKQGIPYEIIEPQTKKIIIRSYADNFK